ncbi:MAG TPA: class F sortase, partial [Dehalococcoidia bacterium]|nr:class F sortase [Dehalococcoidia bacterium]
MNLRPLHLRRNMLIGAAVATLAVGASLAVAVAVAVSGDSDDKTAVAPTSTVRPSPSPSPSPQPSATAEPTATVPPTIPGMDADDRIVIAKANVDAPITLKAVPPAGGELPSPIGPDDVVYYDFAGFDGLGGYPGSGGTIVLSGHVDYGGGYCDNGTEPPPCTAVFWDLTKLDEGDVIEIHLPNGVHRYRVTGSDNLGATDQEKWDGVWTSSTDGERIALITCGGDFNRET